MVVIDGRAKFADPDGGAALPPLAFRVGRYSVANGDRSLARQDEDTGDMCTTFGYEDGGYFGVDDESGNVDTRERQGKAAVTPTIAWAIEQITAAKERWPDRPMVLLAWKEARLWRDVGEKEAVRRFLARWEDVKWRTMEGVRDPHSSQDTLVSSVTAAGNQFYSDTVRENVKRVHRDRLRALKPVTGWPGFGLRREILADDGQGNIIYGQHWLVDEVVAPFLRKAIDDVLHDASIASIVKEWTDAELPTKFKGNWTISTVRNILTAPRLAGILMYRRKEVGPSPFIEPLIDEVTLRRLQTRLAVRKPVRQRRDRQLLTGVLFCSRCERALNSNNKGTRRVYSCRGCGKISIDGEAVDQAVTNALFHAFDRRGLGVTIDTGFGAETKEIIDQLLLLDDEEALLVAGAERMSVLLLQTKSEAIERQRKQLRDQLATAEAVADASMWIAQADVIRRGWSEYSTDKRRTIIFDVLGRLSILPGVSGQAASLENVAARIQRMAC